MQDTKPLLPKAVRTPLGKAALRKEASYIFKYLLFAQVTVYLETGTIPCLLDEFALVFNMNAREQGWLGSVVYIALCAASPLSAVAYKHLDAKTVLAVSLVLNNLCVLGFALTPTGYDSSSLILITMRALIGFTQSFLCVYTPLWVDAFSPRASVAGWMSYLQGSVPLGVMFGYLFGSVSNWLSVDVCLFQCWRWPFLLQFLLVVPLMVGIFFVPSEHLSILKKKKPTTTTTTDQDDDDAHPVMLQEMARQRRKSLSTLSYSFRDGDLNNAQFTAIRASYMTPRFRMDSYDIESIVVDDNDLDMDMHGVGGMPLSQVASSESASGASTQYGTMTVVDHEDEHDKPPTTIPTTTSTTTMSTPLPYVVIPTLVDDDDATSSHIDSIHSVYHTAREEAPSSNLLSTSALAKLPPLPPSVSDIPPPLPNSMLPPLPPSSMTSLTTPPPSGTSLATVDYDHSAVVVDAAPTPPPTPRRLASYRRSHTRHLTTSRHLHHVDVGDEGDDDDDDDDDECDDGEDLGFYHSLVTLLARPTFTLVVLGLSAIYFVVTGVQFWSTIYLQKNFDASVVVVNGLFVVVAGTGPIWGVFFGGALIDRAGGYMGLRQRAKALGICVALGLVAFLLGIVTTFLPSLYLQAASLWLLLFFGGAILPSCTGIFISATPVHLRSLASSVSVMVFNFLGYALAPALTGSFMELIHRHANDPTSYWFGCDEACQYRVGFRCCLAWSVWSLLALSGAYVVATRQAALHGHKAPHSPSSGMHEKPIAIMMH
ncbi:Aste57867_1000 [Aphanomyces stellatus]|uniref:Aste57867_1000 protein n=1 Tax=Aphanomyces stellatus TaxID=120398 RepID=A0A485K6Q8_9STRA|nr:hypothetical protein As57867_000999 [Aphanomyces stellatus]VFT78222.1 Aste57867_1000 [Aphanomyces stellatus]